MPKKDFYTTGEVVHQLATAVAFMARTMKTTEQPRPIRDHLVEIERFCDKIAKAELQDEYAEEAGFKCS